MGTCLLDFGVLGQDGLVARAEKLEEWAGITAQSDMGAGERVVLLFDRPVDCDTTEGRSSKKTN